MTVHPRLSVSAVCSLKWSFDQDLAPWSEIGLHTVGLQTRWRMALARRSPGSARKRPDMTAEELLDYYENQRSKRMGRAPSIPNAVRNVRRYLVAERNPVTGEIHDPGYDCIMEICGNSRADCA